MLRTQLHLEKMYKGRWARGPASIFLLGLRYIHYQFLFIAYLRKTGVIGFLSFIRSTLRLCLALITCKVFFSPSTLSFLPSHTKIWMEGGRKWFFPHACIHHALSWLPFSVQVWERWDIFIDHGVPSKKVLGSVPQWITSLAASTMLLQLVKGMLSKASLKGGLMHS